MFHLVSGMCPVGGWKSQRCYESIGSDIAVIICFEHMSPPTPTMLTLMRCFKACTASSVATLDLRDVEEAHLIFPDRAYANKRSVLLGKFL